MRARSRPLPWRLMPMALLAIVGCTEPKLPPAPQRARSAPVVAQGRPSPPTAAELAAASLEAVDVELRIGRTRVGEAVRLHVSAWRASDGAGFEPVVEVRGPATVTRIGEEIVEEGDGRVRERVDFLIEPSEAGLVELIVLASAPLHRPKAGGPEQVDVLAGPQQQELTLVVDAALSKAALAQQLQDPSTRLERGRRLARQGDYVRAIEAFNLALEHQRQDPVVLGELGWAAFLAGDTGLARRATREALRLQGDPRSRGALLYNLGRIAEALDRDDEAVAAYRRSLAIRPDVATVMERLARLEPTPLACAAASCPITAPLEPIRACELIEEEGCALFSQRGECRCDPEALAELDAIGAWRLLTLTERGDLGLDQVFFLIAEQGASYSVFPPLPGSHFKARLRGGVRGAEQVGELLRVDFEGTIPDPNADPSMKSDGLLRRWSLVCRATATGASCDAPVLTGYGTSTSTYLAPLTVDADGTVHQTVESGTAPSASELAGEFPGFVFAELAAVPAR